MFAFHLPAPIGANTLVHFHGNGEELASVVPLLRALHRAGLGVYAVEYPGYGLSRAGSPSEASLYAAAETALEHLRTRLGVSPGKTVLQGQSLGTGVAVEMALRGYGARLVLISPFTSLPDLAQRMLPFLPARYLVRDRFDSSSKAPRLRLPALVIHGSRDEIVPVDMGRTLAARLPRARLVVIEGARHNDLFASSGKRVLAEIASFASEGAADPEPIPVKRDSGAAE